MGGDEPPPQRWGAIPGVKVICEALVRRGSTTLWRGNVRSHALLLLEVTDICFSVAESQHHVDMPETIWGRTRLLPW